MKTATFYSTGQCNLRCKHCHVGNDQYDPRPELSTEQIGIVFSKLEEAGTRSLTLLGGETSIYRTDLTDIFQLAARHNLKLSLNTNLVSISLLNKVLSSPALLNIVVSVDGASPETHDAIRGPGTFSYTIKNLQMLNEIKNNEGYKWDIDMTFVVNNRNKNEATKIITLSKDLRINKLNIQLISLSGRAVDNLQMLELSDEDILNTLSNILLEWQEMKSPKPKLEFYMPPAFIDYYNQKYDKNIPIEYNSACGGTSKFTYIDLNGNLLPCPNYSYEQKNIFREKQNPEELSLLKRTASEVLKTSLFSNFENFRSSGHHKEHFIPCRFCKYNNICSPCTSDFQGGDTNPVIQPCKAVYEKGDQIIVGSIFEKH